MIREFLISAVDAALTNPRPVETLEASVREYSQQLKNGAPVVLELHGLKVHAG